jgi:hypothetical protein
VLGRTEGGSGQEGVARGGARGGDPAHRDDTLIQDQTANRSHSPSSQHLQPHRLPTSTASRLQNNQHSEEGVYQQDNVVPAQPLFHEVLKTVPGADQKQTTYLYSKVTKLVSEYISAHQERMVGSRHFKLAIVDGDLLGVAFGVRAFHRCQVASLIRT